MTTSEALLFFPHESEDDLDELYENRLFEHQQFFISKFPLSSIFKARIVKMLQMHEAYKIVNTHKDSEFSPFDYAKSDYTENIVECFHLYQKQRNFLKNQIINCTTALEVEYWVDILLKEQMNYLDQWPEIVVKSDETAPPLAIEPDPMKLLKAIQIFQSSTYFTFSDLQMQQNNCPEILRTEAKRLSLCRKLELK